jgi:Kazal-type serine protease inhibitor domain
MRIALLSFLVPLFAACSIQSGSSGSSEGDRGGLGKADLVGSCMGKHHDLCGGHGKGNCWCDEACVDFGDCCSDAEDVCGITPPEPEGTICGGHLGQPCADDEFCSFEPEAICGFADASGVCVDRPEACIDLFKPVCGCNGETYSNSCVAAAAGTSVQHEGACDEPAQFCGGFAGIPCEDGLECVDDPDDDCDPQNGGADCGGICVPPPDAQFCGGFGNFPCPDDLECVDNPNDDCDPNNGGADCGGICVPPEPAQFCGGFANLQCPDGFECADNPDDGCSPDNGGADCGGICVPVAVDSCATLEAQFAAETTAVRACESDDECGQVIAGTSCGCTHNWVARNDADLASFETLRGELEQDGCEFPGGISTCNCPAAEGFACESNVCTWNYL